MACQQGPTAVVKLLFDAGANNMEEVIIHGHGFTPLIIACEKGHEEVVRMLLGEGANKEYANNQGAIPLFMACQQGHTAVLKLLLDEGANMDEVIIQGHERGYTPLFMACNRGHDATVRLLLQYGATSIEENAKFQPAANAVQRQWNALSPARQGVVRHQAEGARVV